MLCKLWHRSLTSSRILRANCNTFSLTLEVNSSGETLSKPLSKKATHGNRVYFFPLTSHTLRAHAIAALQRASEHKRIHSDADTHNAHENTLSQVRRTTTASQGPRAKMALLLSLGILEISKVPLVGFYQDEETRPKCTRWVLFMRTVLTIRTHSHECYSFT